MAAALAAGGVGFFHYIGLGMMAGGFLGAGLAGANLASQEANLTTEINSINNFSGSLQDKWNTIITAQGELLGTLSVDIDKLRQQIQTSTAALQTLQPKYQNQQKIIIIISAVCYGGLLVLFLCKYFTSPKIIQ